MADHAPASPPQRRSRLATIRRLSWEDRRLLVEAVFVLSTVGLLLKMVTFQRVHAVMGRLSSAQNRPGGRNARRSTRVTEVAQIVGMASRHTPIANTCLHRSLSLWWLLRRRGFDSQLRFGARKKDDRFEAHAWIEHEGKAVGDDRDAEHEYARLSWMSADSSV